MKARIVTLRKKKVAPDIPAKAPKKRGRPAKPKTDLPGGIRINRFSPAEYWKRMQLPPTDSNFISPNSLSLETRMVIVWWADNIAHLSRFDIVSTLNISAEIYYADLKRIRERTINMVEETAVEKMAAGIIHDADRMSKEALLAGKPRDAWLIRKEAVEILQSLGVAIKRPEEHKIIEEWDFPGLMGGKGGTAHVEESTKITIHKNGNGKKG